MSVPNREEKPLIRRRRARGHLLDLGQRLQSWPLLSPGRRGIVAPRAVVVKDLRPVRLLRREQRLGLRRRQRLAPRQKYESGNKNRDS